MEEVDNIKESVQLEELETETVKTLNGLMQIKLIDLEYKSIGKEYFNKNKFGIGGFSNLIGRDIFKELGISISYDMENFGLKYNRDEEEIDSEDLGNYYIFKDTKPLNENTKEIEYLKIINLKLTGFSKLPSIEIKVIKDSKMKWIPQYKLSFEEKQGISGEMESLIRNGVIRKVLKNELKINNPVLGIKKKNNSGWRMVVDFRYLNSISEKDVNWIPNVDVLLNIIGRSNCYYFSKIDLKSAFNQILLTEDSRKFTTFCDPLVEDKIIQYEYVGCPFGISCLPYQFNFRIYKLLETSKVKNVINFIDDIIIFDQVESEHWKNVKKIIEILNDTNLRINWEKSIFSKNEIPVLGYILCKEGLKIDKTKLLNILVEKKRPKTGSEVQKILGFFNFFRKFVFNFAQIAYPLEAIKFKKEITWNEELENCYEKIKNSIINAKILKFPDFNKEFILYSDASSNGIGGALLQEDNPIAFYSKTFKKHELFYSVIRKEITGIYYNLKNFQDILLGRKFTLRTDNKSLVAVMNMIVGKEKRISDFLRNVLFFIQRFNFKIEFITSKLNYFADSLSRIPIIENTNFVVEKVSDELDKIDNFIKIVHSYGHFGYNYVKEYVKLFLKDKWNSKFEKNIKEVVEGCKTCCMYNEGKYGYLPVKNLLGEYPWQRICMDILKIYQKETDDGNNYLLVIVDCFTKLVLLRTLKTKSADEVSSVLIKIFSEYGFPDVLISDNGKEFVNNIIKKIDGAFKISHSFSIPYYHEGNGLVERENRTVLCMTLKIIRENLNGKIENWDRIIPQIQFFINQKVNLISGTNPFCLFYGRIAYNCNQLKDWGIDIGKNLKLQTDLVKENNEILSNWELINKVIFEDVLERRNKKLKKDNERINKSRKLKTYKVGEVVMVLNKRTNKTQPKWCGPFKVLKIANGKHVLGDRNGQVLFNNIPNIMLSKCGLKDNELLTIKQYEDTILNWNNQEEEENKFNEKEELNWRKMDNLRVLKRVDYKKLNSEGKGEM